MGVSEEGRQRYIGRWQKDGCVLWLEEEWVGVSEEGRQRYKGKWRTEMDVCCG